MIVIGLTGGIGTGKTAAAEIFADLGVAVIDSDQLAREIINSDSDARAKIIAKFGEDILTSANLIDRDKLRRIIFTNKILKDWLEDLLHPKICQQIRLGLTKVDDPYVIVQIPLLLESKEKLQLDRVLVITCPESLRIERVQKRSKLSVLEIKQIIKAQASQQQLLDIADEVINNDQSLQHLHQQIKNVHEKYLQLATKKS